MPRTPVPAKKKRVRRSPELAREHILQAAIRALSRNGPAACSLKLVAAEAGTSHALITHYFGTYNSLVDAAVAEAMSQVRQRLLKRAMALPHPTPENMLKLYWDIALEPWYGRLVSWVVFSDPVLASQYACQLAPDMKLMAAATEYALSGNTEHAPSRERAETLMVLAWAAVAGYIAGQSFFWRALGRKPGKNRDRDVREALGVVARGLMR